MTKKGQPRPKWDDYFLEISRLVSKRSTCLRRKVGAILVKDNRILATGYNGAPAGILHCDEVGCLREELKIPSGERHELCRGLHAEQNALLQAALHGVSVKGARLYSTIQPCIICAKMLINAGIKDIVICEGYPDKMAAQFLKEAGIEAITRNSKLKVPSLRGVPTKSGRRKQSQKERLLRLSLRDSLAMTDVKK